MTTRTGRWATAAMLLGVLASSGCLLSEKNVEVPFRGSASAEFQTLGFGGNDTESIDFLTEIEDALTEGDSILDLLDLTVEGAYYRVVARAAPTGSAPVTLRIDVWRQGVEPQPLVILVIPDLSAVAPGFHAVPLESAGLGLILEGFDEYVAYRNEGGAPPNLTYFFDLSATSDTFLDVTWEGKLKFTAIGVLEVEIPDPWE